MSDVTTLLQAHSRHSIIYVELIKRMKSMTQRNLQATWEKLLKNCLLLNIYTKQTKDERLLWRRNTLYTPEINTRTFRGMPTVNTYSHCAGVQL